MIDIEEILLEFSDVTPVDIDDPEDGVCRMTFSPDYKKLLEVLFACIKSGEISDRVYRLTSSIISYTPGFITTWIIRQECIKKLGVDWNKEFEFIDTMRYKNEKCYQTWMHRLFVVKESGIYDKEKDFCDSYIMLDNKNIHAWTYRLTIVETYNLWEDELDYTDKYITRDVFNNSAWSYRFTVFTSLNKTSENLGKELDYALSKLNLAPHNEACWNYLTGLLNHYRDFDFRDVAYEAKRLLNNCSDITYAYMFLIEYNKSTFEVDKIREALLYCQKLEELDETRKAYWVKAANDINTYYGFLFD